MQSASRGPCNAAKVQHVGYPIWPPLPEHFVHPERYDGCLQLYWLEVQVSAIVLIQRLENGQGYKTYVSREPYQNELCIE